ncbi:MAG: hypothetical protein WC525_08825 [Candidatus Thermoplasmatota archaeon]
MKILMAVNRDESLAILLTRMATPIVYMTRMIRMMARVSMSGENSLMVPEVTRSMAIALIKIKKTMRKYEYGRPGDRMGILKTFYFRPY